MDNRTVKQFEFIELILAYEGLLTNQRLREKFDISSVQASRVLASYREIYPDNISQVKGQGRGRYAPTAKFIPGIATLTIDRYFQVATLGENAGVEDVRKDFTLVAPHIFRAIHAVVGAGAVQIIYRSMNHPKGIERIIHPKAFVFAGRRWHVRAYDENTGEHRDFNLSRIIKVAPALKKVETPIDVDWEEHVNLLLQPHPLLSVDQEMLIKDELFNGAAARSIKVRRALVQYTLRELEVAVDLNTQQPPEYQLYLYRIE